MKTTFDDGREAQFQEMMKQLNQLQARYKGVRGELLAKVREELAKLKPSASTAAPTITPPPPAPIRMASVASASAEKMLPSCRMCGRGMRLNDADGSLVCDKGHTRPPARAAQPEVTAH